VRWSLDQALGVLTLRDAGQQLYLRPASSAVGVALPTHIALLAATRVSFLTVAAGGIKERLHLCRHHAWREQRQPSLLAGSASCSTTMRVVHHARARQPSAVQNVKQLRGAWLRARMSVRRPSAAGALTEASGEAKGEAVRLGFSTRGA
jgi:hypothetical protein